MKNDHVNEHYNFKISYNMNTFHRNYSSEEESVLLWGLPNGNHVLSVISDPYRPEQVSSITHIVVY